MTRAKLLRLVEKVGAALGIQKNYADAIDALTRRKARVEGL